LTSTRTADGARKVLPKDSHKWYNLINTGGICNMTVKELVEELNKLPQDKEISFQSYDEVFNAEVKHTEGQFGEVYIYLTVKRNKGRSLEMM